MGRQLTKRKGHHEAGQWGFRGAYSFASRFEEGTGTNPEELVGAAHAGCFTMFLSAVLSDAGYIPNRIHTTATVHLEQVEGAPWITKIHLNSEAEVPGVDERTFGEKVQESKTGCPVSKALKGVDISVDAKLVS